ncbi:DUF4169 family protein [Oryzibacter oryziterrae]|uniref:DUF4169 family protein n=1 Tax=Oryzibacter oryziterrae TaxID=2766474 RepID=UPI001F3109DA|nr:DUF4169 family protein [Oryzibacter oryziterrae]
MGDVVNLRLHRKAADRKKREAQADANRAKFGRTKAEKEQTAAVEKLETRRLDGHKREDTQE